IHPGYVTPGGPIRPGAVNLKLTVAADLKGKPVGAGVLGLVRRRHLSSATTLEAGTMPIARPPVGADTDTDGIPNNFDIDDDGDKVIDTSDPDNGSGNNDPVKVFSSLRLGLRDTFNVNALPAGTDISALEDTIIHVQLQMVFTMNAGNAGLTGLTAVNIDCG